MREWKPEEHIEVLFDDSKKHRLKLSCTWDSGLPECLYIMFNPSTADNERCDRTLDRCISLANSNGFGSMKVVNLFSFRTPKPDYLWQETVKSHSENTGIVTKSIEEAETIIVAWGGLVKSEADFSWVLDYAEDKGKLVYCYGENESTGTPKHPLYVRGDTRLEKY